MSLPLWDEYRCRTRPMRFVGVASHRASRPGKGNMAELTPR